ncbi:MAG: amidohydrolase [Clostridia bacterium]|nr:amidohydrolase [Clostridia bacterium]
MKDLLFKKVSLREKEYTSRFFDVLCREGKIFSVQEHNPALKAPEACTIEGNGRLLTSAFYNTHSHSAMTLFRGLGEDLPLDKWLYQYILPAEKHLNAHAVYVAATVAIAEMLRAGICSFSDMYFYMPEIARAVRESGIKANLSRSVATRDALDSQIDEAISFCREYHDTCNGRIRTDIAIHAEYSTSDAVVKRLTDAAAELGVGIQLHLSETEAEHEACLARRGITPSAYFERLGAFRVPVTAAHGVYLTEDDRAILCAHGATVSHNPTSNLKLGSGVMPLLKTMQSGVRVALGSDGAASNNRLDILREMQTAMLLHKGLSGTPELLTSADMWPLATENGALAQGRGNAGKICSGYCADLVLWDLYPSFVSFDSTLMYTATADQVFMTVVDGQILYENGTFRTIDTEQLFFEFEKICEDFSSRRFRKEQP